MTLTLAHRRWSVVKGCGVGFTAYAAASLLMHPTLVGAVMLGSLVVSFILGWAMREEVFTHTLKAFLLFLFFNVLLMLAQRTGYDIDLLGYDGTWGIYGNPNLLGCALAIGLASALAHRLWLYIPPIALGLWLTQSRGALLGASAALFIWLIPKYKTLAFSAAAFGLIAIMASPHGQADGTWQRFGIYQDTLNHLTVFGQGWGSFYDEYWRWPVHRNIGFARAEHAYNDYLELMFELGIGAVLLWAFVLSILSESRSPAKLIIYTYLVLALTYFALWVLPVGQLMALALGYAAKEENRGD